MSRKLIAPIAATLVVTVSVLLHVFAFANSAEPELENPSELRLIIGTCMPTVYDPEITVIKAEKMREDAEELRKHWKARSENK